MKFRKKPVIVEAVRLTVDNLEEISCWCRGNIKGMVLPPKDRVIDIQTSEGETRAYIGDWIIKEVKGGFYPCKPDIFEATYEEVP